MNLLALDAPQPRWTELRQFVHRRLVGDRKASVELTWSILAPDNFIRDARGRVIQCEAAPEPLLAMIQTEMRNLETLLRDALDWNRPKGVDEDDEDKDKDEDQGLHLVGLGVEKTTDAPSDFYQPLETQLPVFIEEKENKTRRALGHIRIAIVQHDERRVHAFPPPVSTTKAGVGGDLWIHPQVTEKEIMAGLLETLGLPGATTTGLTLVGFDGQPSSSSVIGPVAVAPQHPVDILTQLRRLYFPPLLVLGLSNKDARVLRLEHNSFFRWDKLFTRGLVVTLAGKVYGVDSEGVLWQRIGYETSSFGHDWVVIPAPEENMTFRAIAVAPSGRLLLASASRLLLWDPDPAWTKGPWASIETPVPFHSLSTTLVPPLPTATHEAPEDGPPDVAALDKKGAIWLFSLAELEDKVSSTPAPLAHLQSEPPREQPSMFHPLKLGFRTSQVMVHPYIGHHVLTVEKETQALVTLRLLRTTRAGTERFRVLRPEVWPDFKGRYRSHARTKYLLKKFGREKPQGKGKRRKKAAPKAPVAFNTTHPASVEHFTITPTGILVVSDAKGWLWSAQMDRHKVHDHLDWTILSTTNNFRQLAIGCEFRSPGA